MQNGMCPKCQGREVYDIAPQGEDGSILIGLMKKLPIRYLLCAACGYLETYALTPDNAREAAKKGWRVTGEGHDAQ
ncbi:MAG TPA: hypothetical protein VD886_26570 [Herpetosiphonaceae bacterium]|nr:hypothetical protein [Herpetosiphonaceae bacterium]